MRTVPWAIACGLAFAGSSAMAMPVATSAPPPTVTRQQALERADSLFQAFDLNHDGIITRDEASTAGGKLMMQRAVTGRDVAPGIGGHTLKFLEHAFAGMETVDKRQFEQAMLAHFDQMDVDHDGVLTAAERIQATSELSSR
jgi:Ca2+-binding EF-hand superfamily protein